MKVHEHQARELLEAYGIPVPPVEWTSKSWPRSNRRKS